ncbi:MAG: hypothetical protein FJY26_11210 [Betaproteobacteria bacterium]|nr:hypothetical protein [Betaproteobacteria bacterium]
MPSFELRTATLNEVPTLEQLIRDATCFVAQSGSEGVGCGGWIRRRTLFGADGAGGRRAAELTPVRDAAKVRALFGVESGAAEATPKHSDRALWQAVRLSGSSQR